MKTIKKLCCVLLVFAVVMSLGVTAFAENKYENSAGLTPVDGTSLTFKKFLIIGAGDNVPNVTFSYTIAAGTAISTDTSSNTEFQVDAGVDADKVTITDTTFAPRATTYTSVQTGDIDVTRQASDRATGLTADTVPFPVSWTVKMKKKQKETQDILSYHTQAAGCSDKARAKASGGRQPIEECGRTGL